MARRDALYVLVCKIFTNFPFELKKVASNSIEADQITVHEYELLDQLHYKVEKELLKLIESLQKKQKNKQWVVYPPHL